MLITPQPSIRTPAFPAYHPNTKNKCTTRNLQWTSRYHSRGTIAAVDYRGNGISAVTALFLISHSRGRDHVTATCFFSHSRYRKKNETPLNSRDFSIPRYKIHFLFVISCYCLYGSSGCCCCIFSVYCKSSRILYWVLRSCRGVSFGALIKEKSA